jgi:4a-hydroxytetrahydrobiopterin dehydratase
MSRAPLSTEEIRTAIDAGLRGWAHQDDALRKTFRFESHREAISFLVRLSFEAEQRDHHAEIRNVYATVELVLRTHDAGNKVTGKDLDLARAIEAFSWV